MVMSRSYVMEITTEVVRLLSETAPSVLSFPRAQQDRKAGRLALRHGMDTQEIVSGDDLLLSVEVRPGSWSDRKCWLYSVIGRTLYNVIPPVRVGVYRTSKRSLIFSILALKCPSRVLSVCGKGGLECCSAFSIKKLRVVRPNLCEG
ncbi:hypothetical protein PC121_g16448 [Phytophthora cactorum]|nr:hypothetical protein PC121_g16448 [Phytophthora cactorum]